ncbi:TPA: hypothetical protein DEP21_03360 [Patescibacteria group bacterium]|nr:hypothetical protein [Candidatus Gracilibacteria bacterium]
MDKFGDRKTMLENIETILHRSKSSSTMGGGLFGMSEMATKITFKTNHQTSFMERLMMEQDVFKSFIS